MSRLRPLVREGQLLVVDVQNLFFSARERWGSGARIDFKKLRTLVHRQRPFALCMALAFVPSSPNGPHPVTRALRATGYDWEERAMTPGAFASQLELLADRFAKLPSYTTLAVASGDGAFCPLMARVWRELRRHVILYTFAAQSMNRDLPACAEHTVELGPEVLLGDFGAQDGR